MGRPAVQVTSAFWKRYVRRDIEQIIPYQWGVLDDKIDVVLPPDPGGNPVDHSSTKSHALRNLRAAAGRVKEPFGGVLFEDSDVYKWLEAAAYVLETEDLPELRKTADSVVDLIADAQEDDGYLDTFFQLNFPERRFKRLEQSHELYVMGHYIEAGVAYWRSTGSQKALDIAIRMADCIDAHFGDGEGKIHGPGGHPEIELALARLSEATGEEKYARLGQWFLHVRGKDPSFFDKQDKADGDDRDFFPLIRRMPKTYNQTDRLVEEQKDAAGHAVRLVYLCTGLAHIGRIMGDESLLAAARRLWNSIVRKQMYITGQIGSTHVGEAFTYDYDLPNDTMYGETCASVGMCFFAQQMLQVDPRGEYGDVLEKELFNGVLSGVSLDGRHFFYVNPLEADPQGSHLNPDRAHVLTRRAPWFQVACCPENVARLIASISHYIYVTLPDGTVLADQFIASNATFDSGVTIEQTGDYPWKGDIAWQITNPSDGDFRFAVRIPGWSAGRYSLRADGKPAEAEVTDGIARFVVPAGSSKRIELDLDMSVRLVRANDRVRADFGRLAVMRGPVVYCAEQCDNGNDLWLDQLDLGRLADVRTSFDPALLGGVQIINIPVIRQEADSSDGPLYQRYDPLAESHAAVRASLRLIPYATWANREEGAMRVWFSYKD